MDKIRKTLHKMLMPNQCKLCIPLSHTPVYCNRSVTVNHTTPKMPILVYNVNLSAFTFMWNNSKAAHGIDQSLRRNTQFNPISWRSIPRMDHTAQRVSCMQEYTKKFDMRGISGMQRQPKHRGIEMPCSAPFIIKDKSISHQHPKPISFSLRHWCIKSRLIAGIPINTWQCQSCTQQTIFNGSSTHRENMFQRYDALTSLISTTDLCLLFETKLAQQRTSFTQGSYRDVSPNQDVTYCPPVYTIAMSKGNKRYPSEILLYKRSDIVIRKRQHGSNLRRWVPGSCTAARRKRVFGMHALAVHDHYSIKKSCIIIPKNSIGYN